MLCFAPPKACLNREGPAGNGDDGAAVEVVGKLIAVHCGTHEDQTQVRALQHQLLQDGQEEVRLDASLVDLGGGGGHTHDKHPTDTQSLMGNIQLGGRQKSNVFSCVLYTQKCIIKACII